jgi:hypothetical protein
MRVSSVIVLSLLVASCGGEAPPPSQEMTAAERSQIQAEVLDWADQYMESATNLDAMGVALLFDQADAHFFSGSTYWSNWEAIRTGLEEFYGNRERWDGEWATRRVDVLSPEAAVLVGQTTGVLRLDDGREFDNRAGLSFVLRKTDAGWKGLIGHAAASRTLRE